VNGSSRAASLFARQTRDHVREATLMRRLDSLRCCWTVSSSGMSAGDADTDRGHGSPIQSIGQ
jgi:hypothetical protein